MKKLLGCSETDWLTCALPEKEKRKRRLWLGASPSVPPIII